MRSCGAGFEIDEEKISRDSAFSFSIESNIERVLFLFSSLDAASTSVISGSDSLTVVELCIEVDGIEAVCEGEEGSNALLQ